MKRNDLDQALEMSDLSHHDRTMSVRPVGARDVVGAGFPGFPAVALRYHRGSLWDRGFFHAKGVNGGSEG